MKSRTFNILTLFSNSYLLELFSIKPHVVLNWSRYSPNWSVTSFMILLIFSFTFLKILFILQSMALFPLPMCRFLWKLNHCQSLPPPNNPSITRRRLRVFVSCIADLLSAPAMGLDGPASSLSCFVSLGKYLNFIESVSTFSVPSHLTPH